MTIFNRLVNLRGHKLKEAMEFGSKKEPGTKIILTAVGDIMMQGESQQTAQRFMERTFEDPNRRIASGFGRIFENIKGDLNRGDFLFGNLETPLAADLSPQHTVSMEQRFLCENACVKSGLLTDGCVYGETKYPKRWGRIGMPNFNAHPALALTLKKIGFDLVSTANNHALDRGHNGIDRTINSLRDADLDFVGTTRSDEVENPPPNHPYIIKFIKGVGIAFFGFTHFINQEFIGFRERSQQVHIFPRRNELARRNWFFQAIRKAKADPVVDLVVISAHWGIDYVGWIFPSQRKLAHKMLESGADVILGHHSHVLQPAEKYLTSDGRETYINYSLGNFTTDMPGIRTQTAVILYLDITKTDSETFLSGVRYLPVARWVEESNDTIPGLIKTVAIDRYPKEQFARQRSRVLRFVNPSNIHAPN